MLPQTYPAQKNLLYLISFSENVAENGFEICHCIISSVRLSERQYMSNIFSNVAIWLDLRFISGAMFQLHLQGIKVKYILTFKFLEITLGLRIFL